MMWLKWVAILLLALPAYGLDRPIVERVLKAVDRHYRIETMGAAITSTWTGSTDGDAAKYENWSGGLARGSSDKMVIPASSSQAITSNLGAIPAEETLTLTGQPLNTETVVIDAKTYTFQTVLTDVDGNVLIGASTEASLDNLVAAINLTGTAGTDYAASMTVHPTCYATDEAGTTMDVIYRTAGTGGNGTTTTETLTNGSWGAATMSGGAASGLSVDTMFVDSGYTKDIMTSGTASGVTITNKLHYKGSGSFYTSWQGIAIYTVVDSPNLTNAITISGASGPFGATTVEILKGKVINNSTANLGGYLFLQNPNSLYEAPSTAGTHTAIIMNEGTADIGATVTTLYMNGGQLTKTGNALATLVMDGGYVYVNDIASGTTWLLSGGVVDARGSTTAISMTTLIIDESKATLLTNKDFNTWVTRYIGD